VGLSTRLSLLMLKCRMEAMTMSVAEAGREKD